VVLARVVEAMVEAELRMDWRLGSSRALESLEDVEEGDLCDGSDAAFVVVVVVVLADDGNADCCVKGSFGSVGNFGILDWTSSLIRRLVDCVASFTESLTRSPVDFAVFLAYRFMLSPMREADRCASHAYCSPVCLA